MYRGRFAPTPSGPLHFGSLTAALGSFLRARSQGGAWLLRIEDIDETRSRPEYTDLILRDLEALGLAWDEAPLIQSQRREFYRDILDTLNSRGLTYGCNCTRSLIKLNGGHHPEDCRHRNLPCHEGAGIRFRNPGNITSFTDLIRGPLSLNDYSAEPDFLLKRRDGFFAYNLVSVADDRTSGITEIVRGADLIPDTFGQIGLCQALGYPVPDHASLPLALSENGSKYSKQNHAPGLDLSSPVTLLLKAATFLGQTFPPEISGDPEGLTVTEFLDYAVKHFAINSVPHSSRMVSQISES
ncbi:MAG: tRNA glutamyl-Q(34) synthetase GluQRS [Succinimonas sp.]|nr:tRNA glutamyl-Q(34) synthetase GluQRS [Succinimonas sp.]